MIKYPWSPLAYNFIFTQLDSINIPFLDFSPSSLRYISNILCFFATTYHFTKSCLHCTHQYMNTDKREWLSYTEILERCSFYKQQVYKKATSKQTKQMNKKQTHRYRQKNGGYQKGRRMGRRQEGEGGEM